MNEQRAWKILIVDDDADSRASTAQWLRRRGYNPVTVADGESAIERIEEGVAVILTDLKMPHTGGLELLDVAKKKAPHAIVIVVSGVESVDTAVAALKAGADDFLPKPVNLDELTERIESSLRRRAMAEQIAQLQSQLTQQRGLDNMIGTSAAIRALFEKIRLVADTKSTVLITGESGTGKELVARSIHRLSRRAAKPLIPVNCAALPESLVESELFGHKKGAFTGATADRKGLFETAVGGTLFVDEIGELDLSLQAKLLRALENRTVMPIGGSQEIEVDVRLVAATNRELLQQVQNKEFREDLYFRLKVVELTLPPLRERKDDIPLLIRHFIDQISAENERPVKDISSAALEAMKAYKWPGNVRELRNTLEGIIVLTLDEIIEEQHLPPHILAAESAQAIIHPGMTLAEIEREAIRRTLEHTGGHRSKTAELLGISVRTLQRKLKEFDMERQGF
ncbi:Transcriptional regulatory protein ZraR [Stieleria neptunia]|uniref:Transcriptional regulatory protein ZraR n=1 Tax=Stieleria neptunia TaxID=2527979 RepID=A0A518HSA4_9BACT|nr:sigma-54 dependent transcriptional regulator [Stieleria neptunia]QDV43727.1 Transcriptional regulatory protein ZraR [Stieleria neptunia]